LLYYLFSSSTFTQVINVKIYLVDDDAEEAELFSDAIQRVNGAVEFIWHSNVMEALDALMKEKESPDLLFLDLNIPQVSGKQLLKLLRENHVTKDLQVVIYSTTISKRDIDDTAAYNVKSYLQKPDDFQSLCIKLSEILI
jgi:CheY-like chemotaxis protein